MSYDINNHIFRGVPVSDFLACLEKNPAGAQIALAGEGDTKTFLIVDENLLNSLREIQSSVEGFPAVTDDFAIEVLREQGFSEQGPNALLISTVLAKSGISIDDIVAETRGGNDFLGCFDPFGIASYPLTQLSGESLQYGVIEIPSEFKGFVQIASRKENWTLLEDPLRDPETWDLSEPVLTCDLKKNIEWAQNSSLGDVHDYWREEFVGSLIKLFVQPHGEYVEEEDWTADEGDITICSSRYGDVHRPGGMEEGVLYLSISGEMEEYDHEGWEDPEKQIPIAHKKLKEILFGNPDFPTNLYQPQFGG
ncbi:hypothetical protein OAH29_00125 [Akkermansiaceae bacterium]|nr:hypothetical protein [Akkermansiaceae bacterium]